jgi:hypothetical protein
VIRVSTSAADLTLHSNPIMMHASFTARRASCSMILIDDSPTLSQKARMQESRIMLHGGSFSGIDVDIPPCYGGVSRNNEARDVRHGPIRGDTKRDKAGPLNGP